MRVSNACKEVLDCLWFELRIKNVANGGVCFGVVTALACSVTRWLRQRDTGAEAGTATVFGGTATTRAVPT